MKATPPLSRAVEALRALGHPARLRIVEMPGSGQAEVGAGVREPALVRAGQGDEP